MVFVSWCKIYTLRRAQNSRNWGLTWNASNRCLKARISLKAPRLKERVLGERVSCIVELILKGRMDEKCKLHAKCKFNPEQEDGLQAFIPMYGHKYWVSLLFGLLCAVLPAPSPNLQKLGMSASKEYNRQHQAFTPKSVARIYNSDYVVLLWFTIFSTVVFHFLK